MKRPSILAMNNVIAKEQIVLPKTLGRFVWHFLKPYKGYVSLFVGCAMISGLYGVVNSYLTKMIIDALEGVPAKDTTLAVIFWPALWLVINFEIHNQTWRAMGYVNYKIQGLVKSTIISQTFSYVCQQSHQFFQEHLSGKLASQINSLADNIERAVHNIASHIIRGIVLFLAALGSMYVVHPIFALGLFVWALCFTLISLFFSNKTVGLADDHAASESALAGNLVDSLSNVQNIRIFASHAFEASYLGQSLALVCKRFQRKEGFLLRVHLLQGFSVTMMIAFMIWALIRLRTQGVVSIGDYALILGLSVDVAFTLWWVVEQVDYLNNANGKAHQSLKALLVPLEVEDKIDAKPLIVRQGEIIFEKVKFHYRGTHPLFENKSVTIMSGQKVGLVGYSGSGKSTFVHLILRLYDVSSGRIVIDGQDIRDCTQDSLHDSIGMIPQDPSLFHRSLMENIRYGCEGASDQEVLEAARRAHAHEFIMKRPEGYGSLVGDRGVKLSGGQRQRIAIARAMLKNAPILILDEATSQLDSVTENEIQQSLWVLMQGKTTIVIAHRLSTLLHMDRILVFDQGKIVEDGTHRELLAKHSLYKVLWDAQIGGFLPHNRKGVLDGP